MFQHVNVAVMDPYHVLQVESALVRQDILAKNAQAVCQGITSLDPIATVIFV